MSTTNQHNLNALTFATGEFSFARNATSAASAALIGYTDFGNITGVSFSPESNKVEHKGSYRGIRITDRTVISDAKFEYTIKCDEIDREKLSLALLGTPDGEFTQAALSAAEGKPLAFSAASPAVKSRWYDLYTAAGARVRNLTAVVFDDLEEGADFTVDYKLGRVFFSSAQTASLTPTLTAPAIAAGSGMKSIAPMSNTSQKGYGRLTLFDDSNPGLVVYDHVDFSCEITFDSMNEFDGQNFGEVTLKVLVTENRGTVWSSQ